jgi:hypothetical protein
MVSAQTGTPRSKWCASQERMPRRAGDVALHDQLVAEVAPQLAHCDAVILAHFSTSTALQPVREVLRGTVPSGPDVAVKRIRDLIMPPWADDTSGRLHSANS